MPIIIRRNEAIELCITNEAEAAIYDWSFERLNEKDVLTTVFVKLTNPSKTVTLPGLSKNVVSLSRRTESIRCELFSGETRVINRSQVPIILNFVMTDYCSQGRIRSINSIYLNSCCNHQAIYVCLSRSLSADGTVILNDFNEDKIVNEPFKHLR